LGQHDAQSITICLDEVSKLNKKISVKIRNQCKDNFNKVPAKKHDMQRQPCMWLTFNFQIQHIRKQTNKLIYKKEEPNFPHAKCNHASD
jgi:hypothetical protein